ncbi:MAG: radical SAM protein [Candidatus Heimdallarchaeaceae archaeon]
MIVEEYEAKSLIRKSKTSLFSWSEMYLNPYQGCYHDCKYCDGKSEGYYMHDDFASRIRVKKNAPQLLEEYLKKNGFFPINRKKTHSLVDYFPDLRESADTKHKGKFVIFIGGGVCDVYQPVEKEVKMTRKLLEIAYDYKFPVFFLTKNNLILRDLDLLKKINEDSHVSACFTITLADEKKQKIFEPKASTSQERFEAIEKLRKEGIHSGVYFYPTLPFIGDTDENMNAIYKSAKEVDAEFVYCYGLTLKPGRNKIEFMQTLSEHFPDIYPMYEVLYGNNDKYGNLDREKFKEMGLIWPEIKGYKLGYELGLGYSSERYVPEGRFEKNLQLSEFLNRIQYLKNFFTKTSRAESKALNDASQLFISYHQDIGRMGEEEIVKLVENPITLPYITDFLESGESKLLKELEKKTYDSVYRYIAERQQEF